MKHDPVEHFVVATDSFVVGMSDSPYPQIHRAGEISQGKETVDQYESIDEVYEVSSQDPSTTEYGTPII